MWLGTMQWTNALGRKTYIDHKRQQEMKVLNETAIEHHTEYEKPFGGSRDEREEDFSCEREIIYREPLNDIDDLRKGTQVGWTGFLSKRLLTKKTDDPWIKAHIRGATHSSVNRPQQFIVWGDDTLIWSSMRLRLEPLVSSKAAVSPLVDRAGV